MRRKISFSTNDMILKYYEYNMDDNLYQSYYNLTAVGLISRDAWETFEKMTSYWELDDELGIVDGDSETRDPISIDDLYEYYLD